MDKERDWEAFCKLIEAADEISAGKQRSEAALSLMFAVLKQHAFADISRAVSEHIRSCKFQVQPADITRYIEGSVEEKSAIAWRYFLRSLDQYGPYTSVRFPDPAYHFVIEALGGWIQVGESWHLLSEKEIEFRGREWRKLYEVGLRKASWEAIPGKTQVPKYFPGIHEKNNIQGEYLEFIPPVIEATTGELLERDTLALGGKSNVVSLPLGKKAQEG